MIPGNGRNDLSGVILTSVVAPGVAHVTQICLQPELHGKGQGRALLRASIDARFAWSFEVGVNGFRSRSCVRV